MFNQRNIKINLGFKYNNIIKMTEYKVFVLDISKRDLIFQLKIQKDGKVLKVGLDDIDFT